MKNIELTEEHKSKLLEMCKILFPEYDFTLDKWKQCFVTLGLKSKDLYENHIHWFEFCINPLSTKIDSFRTDSYLISHGQSYDNAINSEHPVDYLYEEFKKLKL